IESLAEAGGRRVPGRLQYPLQRVVRDRLLFEPADHPPAADDVRELHLQARLRSSATISLSWVNDAKWPSSCQMRRSTLRSWATARRAAEIGAFMSSSPCHHVTEVLITAGSKSHLPCIANDSSVQPSAPCFNVSARFSRSIRCHAGSAMSLRSLSGASLNTPA